MNLTPEAERGAGYPWPFFVAMAANLLLFFSFQAVFPSFPLFVTWIGGSSADNGLMTWVFALSALLARPLAGFLADRWGRKPVLMVGAIFFASGPLLYTLASNVPLLLGIRAFHGLGMAFFSTAYPAFMADLLPSDRYGEGMGLAGAAASAAMVLAPPFGEWLTGIAGFGLSFAVFSTVGGVGTLITAVLPGWKRHEENAPSTSEPQGNLREVLQRPGVSAAVWAMALSGLPFGAFITFIPVFASERDLGGAGLVFAIYALANTLVRPLAGRIADRWGAYRMALVGLAVVGISIAGLVAVDDRWGLFGAAALFGVGGGAALAALDASVQASVEHALRGSAAAVQYMAFDTLVGFGSLGLGLLAGAAGYDVMYAIVGGITVLGVLVLTRRRVGYAVEVTG
jgi:MFS family permease